MNDAQRARCKHLKSTILETRRNGADIYRRRLCGCCFVTFVSLETVPDGLKMPKEICNAKLRNKLKDVERKPVLNAWDRAKPLSNKSADKIFNSMFGMKETA